MQDHDKALEQLKLLNRAVQRLREDGYAARTFGTILVALRFIDEEVTVHNAKEEKALFPVLERYVEGPTRMMRSDHRKLARHFSLLRSAVRRVQRKPDSFSAIKSLTTTAKVVIQLFVNHIHKENYILFPLVQRFLGKEEMREIAKKML